MNINEIGKLLAALRKNANLTQKQFAEKLYVTDKAVSKWERGICSPDSSLLHKLSLILDVDIETIITNNYQTQEWVFFIDLKSFEATKLLYKKTLLDYLFTSFALSGVHTFYLLCEKKYYEYIKEWASPYKKINVIFSDKFPSNKNVIYLNGPYFIFGSNFTLQILGAMHRNEIVKLTPSNVNLPLYFCPMSYINDFCLGIKNNSLDKIARVKTLGRCYFSFNLEDKGAIEDTISFIKIYERNSSKDLGNLKDILFG